MSLQAWVPEEPTWWQSGVVYQIYPRSFADSSGDGVGDLEGIRRHVDHLAWLGVDAVWLSPMYPSPDVDLGYDVADYVAIHPRYGTMEDFDRLLETLHANGIRLILDLVPNHSSDQHPWFLESRSGRESAKHDWYVWRDAPSDGPPPNNWISYFGRPAWDYLEPPGRWYLHSFHPGQPELNWENPDVRAAIQDVMRFWLDRGVDGFRVDVLWLLGKDPELRDNPPDPGWNDDEPTSNRLLRVNSEDGPRAHEYARLLRSVIEEYEGRVMIGEVVLPPDRAVAYHGEHLDEAHLPHNFALTWMFETWRSVSEWSATAVRDLVERYESLLPEGAWPNWLLGDHDIGRIASRVGPERTRLMHMLLLTLRGTPFWYYGDELDLPDAEFDAPLDAIADPEAATGPGRLVARTPMQWSPGAHAGFSPVEPWLPLASDDPELTVERQRADPQSALRFVRSLIRVRKGTPALAVGSYRSLPAPEDVFSFERAHPHGAVEVHLNFGPSDREIELPGPRRVVLSTVPSRPRGAADGQRLAMNGFEGVIVGPAE